MYHFTGVSFYRVSSVICYQGYSLGPPLLLRGAKQGGEPKNDQISQNFWFALAKNTSKIFRSKTRGDPRNTTDIISDSKSLRRLFKLRRMDG